MEVWVDLGIRGTALIVATYALWRVLRVLDRLWEGSLAREYVKGYHDGRMEEIEARKGEEENWVRQVAEREGVETPF